MNFYMVTRVFDVQSYFYINSEIFGDVEIRSVKNDFDIETKALKKAVRELNRHLPCEDDEYSKYNFSNRISVIIESKDEKEAIHLANKKFIPILDLKERELHISNMNLAKFGIIRNLISGEIKSIKYSIMSKSAMFRTNSSDIQRWSPSNLIIYHANNNQELSTRYIKSLHWSHRANDEDNIQIKILFNYFSLESLFKENENDNITSMVRCFLGFPGGKYYSLIDKNILETLKKDENYLSLQNKIAANLDEIRQLRNDSVHAGFRSIDINNTDLCFYNKLLNLATGRCLAAVEYAICYEHIEKIADFKEKAAFIFNKIIMIDDILNTVVFLLINDNSDDFFIF